MLVKLIKHLGNLVFFIKKLMKSKKILLLEKILHFMAVAVLKRHKPKIVAITGSVGKTSTKTAVFQVLSAKFAVRENQKNYNNFCMAYLMDPFHFIIQPDH